MSFRFPLEAVFHLRQNLEHQQELRLRAANQQVAKVRHILHLMDVEDQAIREQATRELSRGATAAELQFFQVCHAELGRRRTNVEKELSRLHKLRDEEQSLYIDARRERETIQALRESRFREYRKQTARREQRSADEMFLLRSTYERR